MNGASAQQRQLLTNWLDAERQGWQEIQRLVGQITPEQASIAGYLPGWSVKDLLAHLAGWFAEAGIELERTGPGGSDGLSVDEKNEVFVGANRNQPLPVVLGEAITARNRMLHELRRLGRIPEWAENAVRKAGPDHYREHVARLEQWIEELGASPDVEPTAVGGRR